MRTIFAANLLKNILFRSSLISIPWPRVDKHNVRITRDSYFPLMKSSYFPERVPVPSRSFKFSREIAQMRSQTETQPS